MPQSADVSNGVIGSKAGYDEKARQDSAGAPDTGLAMNSNGMTEGALHADEGKELLKLLGARSCTIGQRQEMESKARC